MLNRINMRASLSPLVLLFLIPVCTSPSQAQQTQVLASDLKPGQRARLYEKAKTAQKFDEYGAVAECDEGARLDNFAIELRDHPKLKGYIIFYDGRNELPARVAAQRFLRPLSYLIETRDMDAARINGINGGFREEQATELWLIPEGASAPEPTGTITVSSPKGKTYKFDERFLELPFDESQFVDEAEESDESEAVETPQDSAESAPAAEQKVIDEPPAEYAADSAQLDFDDYRLVWASEEFANAVKEEKGAQACIIYYADEQTPELARTQNLIERGETVLVEKYGLKKDNIVTIFGGYRAGVMVELWVVPANASLPAPTPEERKAEEPPEETEAQ